ncbi:hypothetical protein HHI36_010901 [Cryptolaemus montrouzieri]|uniref:SHSP domain-containing protein n=1 Tax=Cryptolaemus montrouzieri TaxID=559131 RepID=A0ABD2MKA8_9CUCU
MSLLPLLLDDFIRPSRLLDQHFGLTLDPEDMCSPLMLPRDLRLSTIYPRSYLRPWKTNASVQDLGSTVQIDKDKFQANLDVQQFRPEELTVQVANADNIVVIEGQHKERQDEHGMISRHFVRKYSIPKSCDITKVECHLSSDGILTVFAPKLQDNSANSINIPITQTGKPMKAEVSRRNETSGAGDNTDSK